MQTETSFIHQNNEALLHAKQEELAYLEEKARRYRENKLAYWNPNKHQLQFINATASHHRLMFSGSNRSGKTTTGANLVSQISTGRYSKWYRGRKFDGPVRIVVVGKSDIQLRKGAQRILVGEEGQWGTGMLPKDAIWDDKKNDFAISMKRDPKGCIDFIRVKHESGLYSYIYFNTHGQGPEVVQGDEIHVVWCDEAPPDNIYGELIARIITVSGILFITATPTKGCNEVYQSFMEDERKVDEEDNSEDSLKPFFINVSLHELPHLSEREKQLFIESCPPHERMMRIEGLPVLGEGTVYECTRDDIVCEAFELNEYYRFIIGIDFGYNDATAAVLLAQDPNPGGIIYAVRYYEVRKKLPEFHGMQIKRWGAGVPVAWPQDGHKQGYGSRSLIKIKDRYRQTGLNMLPKAAFSSYNSTKIGSNIEAGIMRVYEFIHNGQFKIFDTPEMQPLVKAFMMYHRQKGVIAEYQNDHGLDATRYGVCEIDKAKAGYQLGTGITMRNARPKKSISSFSVN